MSVSYLSNDGGDRTAVVIPIGDYESLLEDLKDLAAIADRRGDDTVPHADFIQQLKEDGILSD